MTDDFGSLRQALSDLSEHGGSTEMYERSLRKSRQSQRRIAITSTAAAAVAVLAIGGTIALATAGKPGLPPSSAPDCPTLPTLEKLVELPKGWSFGPSDVECAEDWAAVTVKRPTPGGAIYLFHYTTGTGWRYHDQGSGWSCRDLGLDEPAPFCTS